MKNTRRTLAAAAPPLRHPRVRGATFGLLAAGLALYVTQLELGLADGALDWALTLGLYYALIVAGALVCVARAIAIPEDRLPWAVIAVGLAGWAAAEIYWEAVLAHTPDVPYPSIADAGWLAMYPTSCFGIVMLARRGSAGCRRACGSTA